MNTAILNQPLVSVIIPCYNHGLYITQSVESIIYQTYKNIQLIVVDDGSRDNSREILTELQSKYHFNLILQKNKGLSATLTETIRDIATGHYICVCSSDDFYAKEKVEQQVIYLETNRQFQACFSKTYHIDSDSNILNRSYYNQAEKKYRSGNIFDDVFLVNITLPVTFMYRRALLEEIGYYSSNIYCEDYYTNLRISSKYQIGFIEAYLYYYRVQNINADKVKNIIVSQKEIIETYGTHTLYNKAKKNWEIRRIDQFCRYSSLKVESFFALLTLKFIFDKRYWKSWVRLFASWKK